MLAALLADREAWLKPLLRLDAPGHAGQLRAAFRSGLRLARERLLEVTGSRYNDCVKPTTIQAFSTDANAPSRQSATN